MGSYLDPRVSQFNRVPSQTHSQAHSQTQSQSQFNSQSNATIGISNGIAVDTSHKASWDTRTTGIFIQLCVVETRNGNRPGSHFNKTGWANLVQKFHASTGRKYTRTQLKNRWDALKKEWGIWTKLVRGETGLGWNHERQTVEADPEWWQRKLQVNPDAAKFKEKGPIMQDEQELLFSDVMANGAYAWTPSSGVLPEHMQDEVEETGGIHVETTEGIDMDSLPNQHAGPSEGPRFRPGAFPARIIAKKAKKVTSAEKIAKCLDRLVQSVENSNTSNNSQRSFTIQSCLDVLDKMEGLEEGDKLWLYASRLFLKPSVRELFLTIKKDSTRLVWLQDQMERDMQRRAYSAVSAHGSRGESHQNDNASSG